MSAKPNRDHIIFDAARGVLLCQHCGGNITWTLPIELSLFVALLNGFMRAHEGCQPNQKEQSDVRSHTNA